MSGHRPTPNWIPVFVAFNALRKQYEATDLYANDEVCSRVASDTILRRLKLGQLDARAIRAGWEWEDDPPPELFDPPKTDEDNKFSVERGFWSHFLETMEVQRSADWLAGDFEFDFYDINRKERCIGAVIGLEVDSDQLPQVGWTASSSQFLQNTSSELPRRNSGRSPAKWWPDFAEELAVYVHESGIPGGQGHDGQSSIIDAVFSRMAEQGKPEPGRGTVQPVVNAILRRIRSAGN